MTERGPAKLNKWPFFIADLVICGAAVFVLYRTLPAEETWEVILCIAALAAAAWGAWLWITPFLQEYKAFSNQAEAATLAQAVSGVRNVETVAVQIKQATGSWQQAQDMSAATVKVAQELNQRMEVEARAFREFLSKANDQERANMRLEIEKLRRAEQQWLEVTVRMLDHTHAIVGAAKRSGQENLIAQLAQFQNACRDQARRMGLLPYEAQAGEAFDERGHHWEKEGTPPSGSIVAETLATGFTFQGQQLRKALVSLREPAPATDLFQQTS
jgi:molecular chaperone GrpE (heat shock protein)